MRLDTRTWNAVLVPLLWLGAVAASPAAAAQDTPPSGGDPRAPVAEDRDAHQGGSQTEKEPALAPVRTLDLSSPRATMTTFLSAIDGVNQGEIERYVDALACLDLSGLDDLSENARNERGRELAGHLEAFISRLITEREIDVERIPDQPGGEAYTCHKNPDGRPAIEIRRDAEGAWRFTWESLTCAENAPPPAATARPTPDAAASAPPVEPPPTESPSEVPITEVPKEFSSARDTLRTFIHAMKEKRIDDASACLDLSTFPLVIRLEQGRKLAEPLYEIIRRVKVVVAQQIPAKPDGTPYIFWQNDKGAIIALARQGPRDDRPGCWLFTKQTVEWVDGVHTMPRWLLPYVPDWAKGKWFLMQHWQWLGLGVVLFLGWVAYRLTIAVLHGVVRLWLARQHVVVDEGVQRSSFRPVGILAASAVWWYGLTRLAPPADVWTVLLFAVKFIACWATVWTVYRAVDLLADYLLSLAAKTRTKVDDLLVPLARKVAKTLVTVFGIVFIVQQFTDETPLQLVAGLGLGGLALALAAQDTLKNLFGSVTVILDRPFKVGDWVQIGDVDGTVESVGFRSTRVRTFYNSQMVVPNSTLMNATVDNYGARRYRRAKTMLSITYSTSPEKVDAFCEGIRELIRLHPYTRKDYYHVYFNNFSASSLDILLYVFFEVPDWSTELRERHRLLIDILRLARTLGVQFAFPTQTVWLERARDGARMPEAVSIAPGRDDPDAVGLAQAARVFEEAYGATPTHRGPVAIDSMPRSKPGPQTDASPDGKRS